MTYRTDSSYGVDESYEDDDDEPRRGLLSWILIVTMLVGTGSGSALIWRTFGGGPILTSTASSTAPAAGPVAQAPPAQPDLVALRQEITGSVQSTQALLAAQQAEIKRLSEQVSVLSGKLELMQRGVASAQAAIPVPQPVVPIPAPKQKSEAKPAAAKPARAKPAEARQADPKPVENKPANGPVSTGGTPLQLGR